MRAGAETRVDDCVGVGSAGRAGPGAVRREAGRTIERVEGGSRRPEAEGADVEGREGVWFLGVVTAAWRGIEIKGYQWTTPIDA